MSAEDVEINNTIQCQKLDDRAILPNKVRTSDSGYDVSAVELNQIGSSNVWTADMKLAVRPPDGWYFDLIGRSSLRSKGWHFAGGVGVIDKTYTGSLKMILEKLDDRELPDLPFCCGQLIPRPLAHFKVNLVEKLPETDRGSGGFGSTDAIKAGQ